MDKSKEELLIMGLIFFAIFFIIILIVLILYVVSPQNNTSSIISVVSTTTIPSTTQLTTTAKATTTTKYVTTTTLIVLKSFCVGKLDGCYCDGSIIIDCTGDTEIIRKDCSEIMTKRCYYDNDAKSYVCREIQSLEGTCKKQGDICDCYALSIL